MIGAVVLATKSTGLACLLIGRYKQDQQNDGVNERRE